MVTALFAALWVCTPGCSSPEPRAYYFSPRGSDADGLGTADRPYGSIAKANQLDLNPGDRVLFEGGQTFDGNLVLDHRDAGTADNPVHVGSYGDGRATIRAGTETAVLVKNAGGVRVADLVVVGDGRGKNKGNGVEFRNERGGSTRLKFVRVENVDASGFGMEGIFVHGAPKDRSPSGYADVRIERCATRDNVHCGIYVTGEYDYWAGKLANADVYVGHCLAAGNLGDPEARHENRSGSGIFVEKTEGATIEYCEAYDNGSKNRGAHGGPVGIWATVSTRVAIQFCRSHHNGTGGKHDGGGFCLDGGVSDSVMQYNVSHDNAGSGFGLYEYPNVPPARGNKIRHNVSRNDGRRNGYAGIHLWNGGAGIEDVEIHDNEVVMAPPAAPQPANPLAAAAAAPPKGIWIQTPVTNVRVSRNRFTVEPGVALMDVAPYQDGLTFAGNEYAAPPAPKVTIHWQGRPYLSVAEWRAATGQDRVSTAQADGKAAPTGSAALVE